MRHLIGLILILGVVYIGMQLYSKYQSIRDRDASQEETSERGSPAGSGELAGLPPWLESSLETARQQGAAGLERWLQNYRGYVSDPRLASIELDYVLLVSRQDPKEARRLFQKIQARVPASSPVYERVQRLARTFE